MSVALALLSYSLFAGHKWESAAERGNMLQINMFHLHKRITHRAGLMLTVDICTKSVNMKSGAAAEK